MVRTTVTFLVLYVGYVQPNRINKGSIYSFWGKIRKTKYQIFVCTKTVSSKPCQTQVLNMNDWTIMKYSQDHLRCAKRFTSHILIRSPPGSILKIYRFHPIYIPVQFYIYKLHSSYFSGPFQFYPRILSVPFHNDFRPNLVRDPH